MITFIPGTHPTYKEQFDKLTAAYIAEEIDAWDCKACFVGNLLNNHDDWEALRSDSKYHLAIKHPKDETQKKAIEIIQREGKGLYTTQEVFDLEKVFLQTIDEHTPETSGGPFNNLGDKEDDPDYENALFIAFEVTLEALRDLHILKGEQVDPKPEFKQRKLQKA